MKNLSTEQFLDLVIGCIKADRRADQAHEREKEAESDPDIDDLSAFEQECEAAVHEESIVREQLRMAMNDMPGIGPAAVLIAGHLVCLSDNADGMAIIPIEKIIRLDNLRIFP